MSMALTVKSRRRLASARGKRGIDGNVKVRMPCARARFPARHGDVQVGMFQGKHAKGRAFFKHPPLSGEQHAQAGGRDPVDLDVYVLGPAPISWSRT